MFKPHFLFSCLSLMGGAQAATFSTPQASVHITATDILARVSVGERRGARFSLRDTLRRSYGPDCAGTLLVTPLSLVGDLLSVELQSGDLRGATCGPVGRTVQVYRLSTPPAPSLSARLGEKAAVRALLADPYLKRHWKNFDPASATLDDLERVMTTEPFYNADDCRLGPAPLAAADRAFAFWKATDRSVNVRLALPFLCDVAPPRNAFLWLGLNVPLTATMQRDLQAARQGRGFLGETRPRSLVRIRLEKSTEDVPGRAPSDR